MIRRILASVLCVAIAGCGGSGSTEQATASAPPAVKNDPTPIVSRPQQGATPGVATSAQRVQGATAEPAAPNIPADARYTLFCARLEGDGHVARGRALKEQLTATTGLRDWYLQHTADGTLVYLGYYRAIDTATTDLTLQADAQRAQKDLAMVKQFRDQAGNRVFARAIFTPIEQPDPDAPPEWNLLNVDAKYFWTVQESAFTDPSLRKRAAVERVREIRNAGLQAFYYHGEGVSSVCIGLWPEAAVENAAAQQAAVPNAKRNEQDFKLFVDTIGLPPERLRQIAGNNANVGVARAVKVVKDSLLLQTTRDFPHSTNYEYDRIRVERNGKIEFDPRPGMVVQIPRVNVGPADQPANAANANEPDLRLIDPDASRRLDQRLRGINP